MKLIAHRGYTTKYIKENTMEAFTNAFNNGFLGIEFDVRKTKDDYLVIYHNAFFYNKPISEIKYKELLNYNFGSKKVPSKVPLLKDVLIKYTGIKLVELKVHIDLSTIINYIDENTYIMSFDSSYIFNLKKRYPKLKFGVLNYNFIKEEKYNLDMIAILDIVANKNMVDFYLKKGIKVFIYGVGDKINYKNNNVYYIVNKKDY